MKKVAVSLHATDDFNPDVIRDLKDFDYIHIDIMDGVFVKNKQCNLTVINSINERYEIPIIVHLMVKNPIDYIDKIIDAIDIFIFHYESEGDIEFIIDKIRKFGKKVGIAINPDTALPKIIPFLNKIDIILIMSVYPGYSEQKFIWESTDKINLLFTYRNQNKLNFEIDVDGGISPENAKFLNVDILTSASSILNADDPNLIIQLLKASNNFD